MEIHGKGLMYYIKIIFMPLVLYSIVLGLLSLGLPFFGIILSPFAIVIAAAYIGITTIKSKGGSVKNAVVAGALFGLAVGVLMGLMFFAVNLMYNYLMAPISDQMMNPGLRYTDPKAGHNPMEYAISITNNISNGLMILGVVAPFICLILSTAASTIAAVLTEKSIKKKKNSLVGKTG